MIEFCGPALATIEPVLLPKMREWRNDPQTWRWTRQSDLITGFNHGEWFQKQAEDSSLRMYSIWENRDSAEDYDPELCAGICGLTSICTLARRAEFSLYITPKFRRTGLGFSGLKTLFYHGFKNMNLNLIWGETLKDNHAQHLFRKIGMTEEGVRRDFYFKDGRHIDAILFSVRGYEFIGKHGEASCFGQG